MQSFFMQITKTLMIRDSTDVLAGLKLCWALMSECMFSHVGAHFMQIPTYHV